MITLYVDQHSYVPTTELIAPQAARSNGTVVMPLPALGHDLIFIDAPLPAMSGSGVLKQLSRNSRAVVFVSTSSADGTEVRSWLSDALHQVREAGLASQAEPIFASIVAAEFEVPSPVVYTTDAGAVMVEWVAAGKRFALFFEKNPGDSGWTSVRADAGPEAVEFGALDTLPLDRVKDFLSRE